MADFKHPETIGLHGGDYRSDPATTAVAVPIYQTTSLPRKISLWFYQQWAKVQIN